MQTLQKEESKEATLTNEIIDKTVQAYQVLIKSKLLTNLGKFSFF